MNSATRLDWLEGNEEAGHELRQLVELARTGVAGCSSAGLSVLRGDDQVETVAATDGPAEALDMAQYRAGDGPCLQAIRVGGPVTVEDVTTDPRWPPISAEARSAGLRSVASHPVADDGHLFGALNLYASEVGAFDDTTQQAAATIAHQGAVTLRYLQLLQAEQAAWAREHAMAETLQWGLLPHIGDTAGVASACRYLASGTTARVGGDWYDLMELPDKTIGVAIGDVMGHGVSEAAAMGQLRSVLRSYAWECYHPAQVLDRLDHLVHGLGMAQVATAIYARLTLDEAGARLRYTNAGHPPPLVCEPDGTTRLLEYGHSLPIGALVTRTRARPEATDVLPPGSTLLCYTDGLVEDRHRDLDEGLTLLRDIGARHRVDDGPGVLCDAAINTLLGASSEDDVAVLAVQIPDGS